MGFQAAQDVLARAVEVIFPGYDHDDLTQFLANQYNVGPPQFQVGLYTPLSIVRSVTSIINPSY